MWKWKLLRQVRLFAAPGIIQPVEFSRPEYWIAGGNPGAIAGGFFTNWGTREAQEYWSG